LQAFHTGIVVAMNPVTQGLPVHTVRRSRLAARTAIKNHCQRQDTSNLCAITALCG
jgi:hypothetical protein